MPLDEKVAAQSQKVEDDDEPDDWCAEKSNGRAGHNFS
jgi:hypothetical protein